MAAGAANGAIERSNDGGFELIAAAEAPDGVENFVENGFLLRGPGSEGAAEILAQGGVIFFFTRLGEGSRVG